MKSIQKKTLLILVFFLAVGKVNAQLIEYKEKFKKSSNWKLSNPELKIEFLKTKFILTNVIEAEEKPNGVQCSFPVATAGDFTIDCKQRLISGTTGNGLFWNQTSEGNYCTFVITDRDGEFSIWQYEDGNSTNLVEWNFTDAIVQNFSANQLRIEKTGTTTYFYINNVEVASLQIDYPISMTKSGIFLGNYETAELEVTDFNIILKR